MPLHPTHLHLFAQHLPTQYLPAQHLSSLVRGLSSSSWKKLQAAVSLPHLERQPHIPGNVGRPILMLGMLGLSLASLASMPSAIAKPMQAQEQGPLILEQPQPAVATVTPSQGKINVKLINHTNAVIRYQVIDDTQERSLSRVSSYDLQKLKVPSYITFYREDRGFLLIKARAIGSQIVLTFDTTEDFAADRTTMEVRADGKVFLK